MMGFGRKKLPGELQGALERYAGKMLVEVAAKNPDVLKLGASRRHVSLAYLDIWGFMDVTDYASPDAVTDLLCEYFSRMTRVVRKYRGFVDKFFGDAMFNIFGAPVDDKNHAEHACTAALAALAETRALSSEWHEKGFGGVNQSIGIVTGPAIVGNIGNEQRAMYTAIGEAVSLTVQLQQASRIYGAPVVISRETQLATRGKMLTRELDTIKVSGTDRVSTVYELLGPEEGAERRLRRLAMVFEMGLKMFRNRDWPGAEKRFLEADRMMQGDQPSRLYLKRCEIYRKKPPPPEWDTAKAHTVKLLPGEDGSDRRRAVTHDE